MNRLISVVINITYLKNAVAKLVFPLHNFLDVHEPHSLLISLLSTCLLERSMQWRGKRYPLHSVEQESGGKGQPPVSHL